MAFKPATLGYRNIKDFMVALAQLVRAPDCDSGGRRFNSGMPPFLLYLLSELLRMQRQNTVAEVVRLLANDDCLISCLARSLTTSATDILSLLRQAILNSFLLINWLQVTLLSALRWWLHLCGDCHLRTRNSSHLDEKYLCGYDQ